MSLEGQTRGNSVVLAESVVERRVLLADRDLRSYLDVLVIWDLVDVPRSKARWVAVVAALLVGLRAVEIAVEVHLLSGVVLVDAFAGSVEVVDAVFHRVDGACHGLFGHADRVPKTPAKDQTVIGEAVG